MNTVIRIISGKNVRMRNCTSQITKQKMTVRMMAIILVIVLFCSAFGVVYFKDLNRRLFIQYQILQHEQADKLMRWGKLLLEQTTWSAQSYIQRIAEQQLSMKLPSVQEEVVLVNVKR